MLFQLQRRMQDVLKKQQTRCPATMTDGLIGGNGAGIMNATDKPVNATINSPTLYELMAMTHPISDAHEVTHEVMRPIRLGAADRRLLLKLNKAAVE